MLFIQGTRDPFARRELLEETGYEAQEMEKVAEGTASAGITDEVISIFSALVTAHLHPSTANSQAVWSKFSHPRRRLRRRWSNNHSIFKSLFRHLRHHADNIR